MLHNALYVAMWDIYGGNTNNIVVNVSESELEEFESIGDFSTDYCDVR